MPYASLCLVLATIRASIGYQDAVVRIFSLDLHPDFEPIPTGTYSWRSVELIGVFWLSLKF